MNKITVVIGVFLVMCFLTDLQGLAQSTEKRIADLEKKVEALSMELENDQWSGFAPPIVGGEFGMAPGASKVYQQDQGISIGGYGEGLYQNFEGDKTDQADFLRAVLYVGYKFNDQWVFNSEIEFEHASTSAEGSASAEFAYLDYLYDSAFNFRAGLLLVPVGIVNELHEPTTFLSAKRPTVENRLIPTTWRENGLGFFGDLGPVSYKTYVVNGLRGEKFSAKGLRGGRQKGSEALADDLAWVGRVDYQPTPGLSVGGSVYYGDSGQDLEIDLTTLIYEGHVSWEWRGLDVKLLAVGVNLDDVAELNRAIGSDGGSIPDGDVESVGEDMFGWYVQIGYDVLSNLDMGEISLTPFVRYEEFDTQDSTPAGFATSGEFDVELVTVGLNYKPIDQVVFKADYQFEDTAAGSGTDQFNLSMGYVF